jgi:hypothetical protein
VRSVWEYQVRPFQILLAQVSNDDGKQIVFSGAPAEADRQRDQLRGVLHRLGATPTTPVAVLSDSADRPRSLGETASVGPTHHVLDRFHFSVRIQHVAQAAKGWSDTTTDNYPAGAHFAETIERIRWRLWHGQVKRGLDLIGETLVGLDATIGTAAPAAATAGKVARHLVELEAYVSGQSEITIDYAATLRCEEPISTPPRTARCSG